MKKKTYERALKDLQARLVGLQNFVVAKGLRVVIIFEGRDAAGKGGTIKRLVAPLNPRNAKIVALGKPSPVEQSQWYFQRYVQHLPSAGQIVCFDRSWYNRAGVEPVMGFCTPDQHRRFLDAVPGFEQMLTDDGIVLLKYWFSVSAVEQERRLQARLADPTKRWKLSPIDLRAREMWREYGDAKDQMFEQTHKPNAPWFVVPSDNKRRARLNCIAHLLEAIPHQQMDASITSLPPRTDDVDGLTTSGSERERYIPQPYG